MPLISSRERWQQGAELGDAFSSGLQRVLAQRAALKLQELERDRDIRESSELFATLADSLGFPGVGRRARAGELRVTPELLQPGIDILSKRAKARDAARDLAIQDAAQHARGHARARAYADLTGEPQALFEDRTERETSDVLRFLSERARGKGDDFGPGSTGLNRLQLQRDRARDAVEELTAELPQDFKDAYEENFGFGLTTEGLLGVAAPSGASRMSRKAFQEALSGRGSRWPWWRRDPKEQERNRVLAGRIWDSAQEYNVLRDALRHRQGDLDRPRPVLDLGQLGELPPISFDMAPAAASPDATSMRPSLDALRLPGTASVPLWQRVMGQQFGAQR